MCTHREEGDKESIDDGQDHIAFSGNSGGETLSLQTEAADSVCPFSSSQSSVLIITGVMLIQ